MTKTFERRSRLERLRATLRQWMYPAEFRIAEAAWSPEVAARLEEALTAARAVESGEQHAGIEDKHLIAIGTRLWRLRDEMTRDDGSQQTKALRQALKHLEVLWDRFAEAGLEIYDHTGEVMPEGNYPIKTIAYQETNRVPRDRVIETVKPTIKFNKKIIQFGEVIVSIPEKQI